MRRLFFVLIMAMCVAALFAQTPPAVDQLQFLNGGTMSVDPVTEDIDGTPLPPEFVITYEWYIYSYGDWGIDDSDPANVTLVATTTTNEAPIDLSGQPFDAFFFGVRYVVDNGQGGIFTSGIGWSYDSAVTNPTPPFVLLHVEGTLFLPLPVNLHLLQT